jgi:Histone methylation protein DOT1
MTNRPTLRNRGYILCRDFALLGPKEALGRYVARLQRRLHTADTPQINPEGFDMRFGVNTSMSSLPENLRIRSSSSKLGIPYVPTPENIFRQMLQYVQRDLRDHVFVDMGAGKGLVLLLATEYPFKKIVGVEYSEALTEIARDNIRAYCNQLGEGPDIECFCADASRFALPPEPMVLYFYNPFQGKVMDQVIKNLEHSLRGNPRDVWVLYLTPWEHRKFKRSANLQVVESNWRFCVYRSKSQN